MNIQENEGKTCIIIGKYWIFLILTIFQSFQTAAQSSDAWVNPYPVWQQIQHFFASSHVPSIYQMGLSLLWRIQYVVVFWVTQQHFPISGRNCSQPSSQDLSQFRLFYIKGFVKEKQFKTCMQLKTWMSNFLWFSVVICWRGFLGFLPCNCSLCQGQEERLNNKFCSLPL